MAVESGVRQSFFGSMRSSGSTIAGESAPIEPGDERRRERERDARAVGGEAALDDRRRLLRRHQERHREAVGVGHRGLDEAGHHHVHLHALRQEIAAQAFAPGPHRGLAAAVGGRAGQAAIAGEGRDDGDLPAPARGHARDGRQHDVQHAVEVDREDRARLLRRFRAAVGAAGNAGIGDDEVERRALVRRGDPLPPQKPRRTRRSIAMVLVAPRAATCRRDLGEALLVAAAQRQMRARPRIGERERGADAGAGAGDQDVRWCVGRHRIPGFAPISCGLTLPEPAACRKMPPPYHRKGTSVTIASMTGFARRQGSVGDFLWAWELKCVNGRNLEVRCRCPNGFDGCWTDSCAPPAPSG